MHFELLSRPVLPNSPFPQIKDGDQQTHSRVPWDSHFELSLRVRPVSVLQLLPNILTDRQTQSVHCSTFLLHQGHKVLASFHHQAPEWWLAVASVDFNLYVKRDHRVGNLWWFPSPGYINQMLLALRRLSGKIMGSIKCVQLQLVRQWATCVCQARPQHHTVVLSFSEEPCDLCTAWNASLLHWGVDVFPPEDTIKQSLSHESEENFVFSSEQQDDSELAE